MRADRHQLAYFVLDISCFVFLSCSYFDFLFLLSVFICVPAAAGGSNQTPERA